jgi:hypothetical protein
LEVAEESFFFSNQPGQDVEAPATVRHARSFKTCAFDDLFFNNNLALCRSGLVFRDERRVSVHLGYCAH